MKKSKYFQILLSIVLCTLLSCDKVKLPYKMVAETNNDTNEVKVRKVLLEEYTGHQCPNCPSGAIIAHNLKALYGEKLVLITVHAGWLARTNSSGPYTYDFRTIIGEELNPFFGMEGAGYPDGMINRMGYVDNMHILGPSNWGAKIASVINNAPDAFIELKPTYNSGTRQLDVQVETEFLNVLNGTYMLSVYVTEDSIIKPQMNSDINIGTTPDILDYVHRDVLRGSFNGTWGDTLATGPTSVQQHVIKNYSLVLNSGWDETHCKVVAFIYRKSDYEVIQAEEHKAIP